MTLELKELLTLKHHKVEEGVWKLVDGNKYEWCHHHWRGSFEPNEYDKAVILLDKLKNKPGQAFTHYRVVSG